MNVRILLGGLIGIGVIIIGIGVYFLLKPDAQVVNQNTFSEDTRQPVKTEDKTEVRIQTSRKIEVPMNRAWTETGLQISAGQTLAVTASGRGVWKNISPNNPNAVPFPFEECSPDGTSPNAKDYHSNIHVYQTSLANKGALIGKVGDYGVPFKVGSKLTEACA